VSDQLNQGVSMLRCSDFKEIGSVLTVHEPNEIKAESAYTAFLLHWQGKG
jgi:hypothetical protein